MAAPPPGLRCRPVAWSEDFFVVSGFLITTLLLKEEAATGRIDLGRFYLRRAFRLLPVLFLFLTTIALLTIAGFMVVPVQDFVRCLTFTRNYGSTAWADAHLWSLSVEAQFYALWAVAFAWLGARGRVMAAVALLLAVPFYRMATFDGAGEMRIFDFGYNADSLMFGCLAAMLLWWYRPRLQAVSTPLLLGWQIGCTGLVYAVWFVQRLPVHKEMVDSIGLTLQMGAVAALVVSAVAVRRGPLYRLLNGSILQRIGLISYGLYVWQQIFVCLPGTYLDRIPLFTVFPVNLFAAGLMAWLSYRLVERPFLLIGACFRAAPLRQSQRAVSAPPQKT